MAPVPQEHLGREESRCDEEAVVISGISCLMPGCHDIMEFSQKLYDKVNMVKCDQPRWSYEHPELPKFHGKVPGLDQFDAQFFMINYWLGNSMDAMSRKLLEQSYQAIIDAGVCPTELSGKRVGVYVASSYSETEKMCSYSDVSLGILGCNRSMYANRISYWLNVRGPSIVMDASCASSMVALENAFRHMMEGECDSAIVGGCKILLHPQSFIHYSRLVPLNSDGRTKCYDENADGQSMSEAVNAIYLQRHKNAKRIYATLCYAKTTFSVTVHDDVTKRYKFGPHRDVDILTRFLKEFYDEAGISPSMVEFVEGFGTALPETDKAELLALQEVFCKDRSKENPLLVGSVMSNMGYTEAASAYSAIVKILLAYHNGQLAANLNCENPRKDIPALQDGRMKIITDHHKFRRTYTALNNLSFTGVNGHALFQGYYKLKDLSRYQTSIPYLVTVSGRKESCVQIMLDDLKPRPLDAEEIALFHNIHKMRISGHLARGYGVFATNEQKETVCLCEKVDYYDDARSPLWFVYSGMGSQWAGMGAQLMKIPIFAAAIERCRKVLEPKGVDLMHIITAPDKTIYDNILNSFVGIAAVQIGLTDVLKAVGLVPDKIIGHSVGELGCAYADGCFTAEEMILSAYSRGLVSVQTPFIRGSMAAVGIGYKQVVKMCPPEIEVACHNGPESSTISGPADKMKEFVGKLTAQGIFAKEVPCSNIAYHSRYIAEAGPGLLKYLSEVIKEPKRRSDRWVSTSVPLDRWNEPSAQYSSAHYHTNNLLNPVLFEETSRLVPANAVLVEIAPHGLLQAILKRSLPSNCRHVPLTRRGHADNTIFLLEALGKLYMEGYDVDVSALYPKVEFPVSTPTRPLSHLVKWTHAEKWNLCQYVNADRTHGAVYKPIITTHDEEYKFLSGHVVDGMKVFPMAETLVSVWDTLAMSVGKQGRDVSVQFRDVNMYEQPPLHDQRPLYLKVTLQRGSGRFEVTYEYGLVADGYIVAATTDFGAYPMIKDNDKMDLLSHDFYKLLYEKGYEYKGQFLSVHKANLSLTHAELVWKNNWTTLIDGVFQVNTLRRNHTSISQPLYIRRLCIDIKKHLTEVTRGNQVGLVDANVYELQNATRCGGLLVEGLTFKDKPLLPQNIALKTIHFVPFFQHENIDIKSALYVYIQMAAEYLNKQKLNVLDVNYSKSSIMERVIDFLDSSLKLEINIQVVKKEDLNQSKLTSMKPDVIILNRILADKKAFEDLSQVLTPDTFVINIGVDTNEVYPLTLYRPVSMIGKGNAKMELALWKPSPPEPTSAAVSVRTPKDLEHLRSSIKTLPPKHKLYVITNYPPPLGLKELIKQNLKDSKMNQIYVASIKQYEPKEQELDSIPNFDMVYNIYDKGVWGGEYFLPLEKTTVQKKYVSLQSTQLGDLNSLTWIATPMTCGLGINVTVHYAGLGVNDAKRAMSEVPIKNLPHDGYGMDFSGVTDNGTKVMGIVFNGSASTQVKAHPDFLWPIPSHWSMEDAATVPLPYAHAFYCLGLKIKLYRGMSILVHGAVGALGQAAISIALAHDCRVFATVSDIKKKHFLRKLFPHIKDECIGNSRDQSFADMVLSQTKGVGVDLVLSCVKAEFKTLSMNCVAPTGVLMDVSLIPTQENYSLGMYQLTNDRTYMQADFSSIFHEENVEDMKIIQHMISEGISKGYVRPLSRILYSANEPVRAFKLLAASRHRGRVLLKLQGDLPAKPMLSCSMENCHLILCDEDETFNLQLAEMLVRRGVKKLRLHCTRPSPYLHFKKLSWQELGVEVRVSSEPLNDNEDIIALINDSNRLGLVESIYILATGESNKKYNAKTNAVFTSLDNASRTLCKLVKHFVIIGEENSLGKSICQDRAQNNLPSLYLELENLQKFHINSVVDDDLDKNNICLKWNTALDAVEKALCSNGSVKRAYIQIPKQKDFLDEISIIIDKNVKSSLDSKTTLEDIGVDTVKAKELSNLLMERFRVVIPKDTVLKMTIPMLKKLQVEFTDLHKEVPGFTASFNYVDLDELQASGEMVLMPTLVQSSQLRFDEFNSDQRSMFLIPGIEGHSERLNVLCERLKVPAVVLQPGLDKLGEPIPEMAHRFVNVIMKNFNKKDNFHLLGYEIGVFIALEMAKILESHGYTGTVYCLGGTPEDIQIALLTQLNELPTKCWEDALILHMSELMSGKKFEDLDKRLHSTDDWLEKLNICETAIRGHIPHSVQYACSIISAVHSRLTMTLKYQIQPKKLKSRIVLLRALLSNSSTIGTLKQFSDKVTSHQLRATLGHAAKDLRCSTIINKYLDPELLEAYDNMNHCETYLLNDALFIRFLNEHN